MTFLEAAKAVLSVASEPLHFEEIARRALDQGLITTAGATPDVTMGSRLYTVTKQGGSDFERVGKGMFGLARKEPGGLKSVVAEIESRTRDQLHALLAQVHPKRFEALIMELLLQMGFEEKTLAVTQFVKDGGIDVVGTYSAAGLAPVNAAVQVKRWKHNVQSQTVTQLRGSLQVHQYGIIITTSDFSKSARQEAEAPGKMRISLINGDRLIDLLVEHHVGVVTEALLVTRLDKEWWGEVLEAPAAVAAVTETPLLLTNEVTQTVIAAKPKAVTILEATFQVKTWKGVLMAVAEETANRHPVDFPVVALSVHGKSRHYVGVTAEAMIAPEPIGDTGLWIETNQSAARVQTVCRLLMEAFSHASADLQI